jgi:pimeloyl-ACP methyl ester carboxylesterase
VVPALERRHEVFAPTLAGHAGGPPLDEVSDEAMVDAIEAVLDEAGFEQAHLVGNSLGGYLALRLAARGRALTVVAFAPAGGWAVGDDAAHETLALFTELQGLARAAAPHADAIMSSANGRRRATEYITMQFEHLPAQLLAHQLVGAATCDAAAGLIELAQREGWHVEAERITCPVRIVWGTDDRILGWPRAAARYREQLSHADWVVLDGVGHCPQLDIPLEAAQLILGFTSR